ncbi:hypothetical protein EBR96_03990, partial [bacterium]|nr:hypothetical protein [bacterium]
MSEQLERYQQLIRDAFPKDETPREIKPIPPEIWFKNLQGLLILHQLEHLTLEKEGLAVTITPTQYFTHYPNDRQFSFAFQSGVAILDKSPCSIDTLLFCINDL